MMETKIIDGEEWVRKECFLRYVDTHNIVFKEVNFTKKIIKEIESSVNEEIEIIQRYIEMVTPITEDSRAWLRDDLKEAAESNLEELEIRKSQLSTVKKHIIIARAKAKKDGWKG